MTKVAGYMSPKLWQKTYTNISHTQLQAQNDPFQTPMFEYMHNTVNIKITLLASYQLAVIIQTPQNYTPISISK